MLLFLNYLIIAVREEANPVLARPLSELRLRPQREDDSVEWSGGFGKGVGGRKLILEGWWRRRAIVTNGRYI